MRKSNSELCFKGKYANFDVKTKKMKKKKRLEIFIKYSKIPCFSN